MSIHIREVLLRFFRSAGAQTLVVFYFPGMGVLCGSLPRLKLWQTKECSLLLSFSDL